MSGLLKLQGDQAVVHPAQCVMVGSGDSCCWCEEGPMPAPVESRRRVRLAGRTKTMGMTSHLRLLRNMRGWRPRPPGAGLSPCTGPLATPVGRSVGSSGRGKEACSRVWGAAQRPPAACFSSVPLPPPHRYCLYPTPFLGFTFPFSGVHPFIVFSARILFCKQELCSRWSLPGPKVGSAALVKCTRKRSRSEIPLRIPAGSLGETVSI